MPLRAKFSDPDITAGGDKRASVDLAGLRTLWFNTGTLCNIACHNCFMESSPLNARLAYIDAEDVRRFIDEIAEFGLPTTEIAFTGGEPFMNPDMIEILEFMPRFGFRRPGSDQRHAANDGERGCRQVFQA